jgi:large subunit ribosomal protein L23
MNHYDIISRPRVTEKSVHLQNKRQTYVFEVHQDANKVQIRDAVERLFQVKVQAVRTVNCRGKDRRTRMSTGTTPAIKKAYVTLRDGQKIEGF